MRLSTRLFLPFLAVFAATACDDATSAPASGTTAPVVASISLTSGNDQVGLVGANLSAPISTKVTTTTGAAASGAIVQFVVANGSATVTPTSVTTATDGIAAATVTIGSAAGAIVVTATVVGTSISTTIRATAVLADPDSTSAATVYNPDWTEASHGKVTQDYTVAFPQAAVNTIEIRMTATQWAEVRTDMTALYGYDFGARPNAGAPATDDDPAYIAVPVTYNAKVWKKVGWRLKGNSTLASAWGSGNYKLPFRLKLNSYEDTYPAIKGQRFYGFKELSFSPAFKDNSLIREKVAADLFRAGGVPAARTAFYRVSIDYGAGLRYAGVYTAVEVIDDTMVKDQFGDDKGNIYKPESSFATFVESQFEKKNNKTSDFSDVQGMVTALNDPLRSTNATQWRANLEAVFNVNHFLRWLAINNAIVNWDSYGTMAHNYYLYNHPSQVLTWIPWDHNESMTGSPGITGTTGQPGPGVRGLSLSMNEVSSAWPLIRNVIADPVYQAQYKANLKAFNENVFTQAAMIALFDKYHALIAPYVVGVNGEQAGATHLSSGAAFTSALSELKAHVATRKALIASYAQ